MVPRIESLADCWFSFETGYRSNSGSRVKPFLTTRRPRSFNSVPRRSCFPFRFRVRRRLIKSSLAGRVTRDAALTSFLFTQVRFTDDSRKDPIPLRFRFCSCLFFFPLHNGLRRLLKSWVGLRLNPDLFRRKSPISRIILDWWFFLDEMDFLLKMKTKWGIPRFPVCVPIVRFPFNFARFSRQNDTKPRRKNLANSRFILLKAKFHGFHNRFANVSPFFTHCWFPSKSRWWRRRSKNKNKTEGETTSPCSVLFSHKARKPKSYLLWFFFVSSERAINAIEGDRHRPLTNPRKICEKKLSQLFQKVSSIRWNERRKTKRKCSRVNPPIGDASANEKRPRRRRYELRLRLVEGS